MAKHSAHRTATERRRAVRIEGTLSVRINERQCVTNDFSLTGLQIRLRAGAQLLANDAGEVDLTIYLSPESQVRAVGRIVWVAESDDECLVGIEFARFIDDGAQAWSAFVPHRERPTVY